MDMSPSDHPESFFAGDETAMLERVYARSAEIRGRRRSLAFGASGFLAGVAATVAVVFGLSSVSPGAAQTGLRIVQPARGPGITIPAGPHGRMLWRSASVGAVGTLPAYGENRLFVAAADRAVYALDAGTGSVVWSHTVCCSLPTSSGAATIDYALGRVLIAAPDAPLQALDARSGQPAWTTAGPEPALSDGGVAVAPPVVVSAGPSGIRAYRVATGDPIWSMGGVVARLAAPNATSVFVVVPGAGGGDQLWNLDLASGKVRWRHDLGATVHGRFSATRDSIYVVDDLGALHAIAAADGHQRWLAQIAPSSCGTKPACSDNPGGFRSQPNVTGNLVTVGDDAGFMRAFDTNDGTMRWQLDTGAPIRSSPLVSHDALFFANDDANLFAVNLATGEKEWSADMLAPVRSQPTVAYGVVYVTDTTGHVTAIVD